MAHGLDEVETEQAAALPRGAADRILALVNYVVVKASVTSRSRRSSACCRRA